MGHPNTTSISPEIAFIIGMGRSGTTLLTNMLNSHPEVIATPENEFVIHSFQAFEHQDFNNEKVVDAFIQMFDQNFNRVISIWKPGSELKRDIQTSADKSFATICKLAYLNYPLSHKEKKNVTWVVDKNPSYSMHIEKLNSLFPKAKFIVIVRDYRDNILSRRKYSDENVPIHKLAADWNYYYERIFRDLKKCGKSFHLIRYEDLAENPTDYLSGICNFIGVPYTPEMLNFQDLSKEIRKHATENVSKEKNEKIQRMHANLEKKVNTERVKAYKNELTTSEIALLDVACEDLAKKFGYKKDELNVAPGLSDKLYYRYCYLKTSVWGMLINFKYRLPVAWRPGPSKQRM